MIHICSLRLLEDSVTKIGASHVVTLINEDTIPETPPGIEPENHLKLGMNDITETMTGYIAPSENHVSALIDFVSRWNLDAPMIFHCWAGISRSTAAGYTALCLHNPKVDERVIAKALREASTTASPNRRIIAIADSLMGRGGRMISAIEGIGPGNFVHEGIPFSMPARFQV